MATSQELLKIGEIVSTEPDTLPHYWIDTDPGVDDAIAILLAIQDVGNHLLGFSTVQGNVREPQAAHNLARLIAAVHRNDIAPKEWVPMQARGSDVSLIGSAYRSDSYAGDRYHGTDGLGNVNWRAPPACSESTAPVAAQAIVAAAHRSPGIHLVCLGPLTNLALALRIAPELPSLVGKVIIMGGSLRAGGNETMASEFNFVADAEAAQIVLQAGFSDVVLVPIDACEEVGMRSAERVQLASLRSPASTLANDLVASWDDIMFRDRGVPLYDAVAWLVGTRPSLARWETVYLAVDTGRGLAHGASIADWRSRSGHTPNVRAAVAIVSRADVFEHMWQLLK